jgi:hypothetical protein
MNANWSDLLKTVAPWIGTAIAGPLGGIAAGMAADALGLSDKTKEAVQDALSGKVPVTQEQLMALKQKDQEFALQMRAMGIKEIADLETIAAGDRDSARKMQIAHSSPMPAWLTTGVGIVFAATLVMLFTVQIPPANRDLIVYMCGQLAAAFGACLAFWVGTTRQTENQTKLLAQSTPLSN